MNWLLNSSRKSIFSTGAILSLMPRRSLRMSMVAVTASAGVWLATPAWADPFSFSTGTPDGLLGTLSQPASAGTETETADDFILSGTTTIAQATIIGLIPAGTPLASITNVEVEIYHVFPNDSVDPPSGNVPARANSPGDVEIDGATRDASQGSLTFSSTVLNPNFSVVNSVADGINKAPDNMTLGEGPESGEMVQITIDFVPSIVLSADHYFFRPEVEVNGGDFFFVSAPKPIVAPGTPFNGDLQAWIRNTDLKPDWLRIGTDIIGGNPVRTFNMAFTLSGEIIGQTVTPTSTATPTATPVSTATSRPVATSTLTPSMGGGSGCSASPSANNQALWLLLTPAALLWSRRQRRG